MRLSLVIDLQFAGGRALWTSQENDARGSVGIQEMQGLHLGTCFFYAHLFFCVSTPMTTLIVWFGAQRFHSVPCRLYLGSLNAFPVVSGIPQRHSLTSLPWFLQVQVGKAFTHFHFIGSKESMIVAPKITHNLNSCYKRTTFYRLKPVLFVRYDWNHTVINRTDD